jgi:hypothetical protein
MRLFTLEIRTPVGERFPLGQHKSTTRQGAEKWARRTTRNDDLGVYSWCWASAHERRLEEHDDLEQDLLVIVEVGTSEWDEDYTGGKA